ncbi:SGNH/GDSL hydrolase family protein [Gordonia sp. NPDC003376]
MQRIVALTGAATWRTPVALVQGLRARKTVVRLPQAVGDHDVIGDDRDGRVTRLVVLGDSLAGGVGVDHHRDTLAGGVARRLAARVDGPVEWHVYAQTGFTAREAITLIDPEALSAADVVVVSVGANDAKNMVRSQQWRIDLTTLMDAVVDGAADAAQIVLLPVPILDMCPALPGTLAAALGRRAARFDAVADEVAARNGRIRRFDRFIPPGDDLFAADGFHPSESFHGIYAGLIDSVLTTPITR